MNEAKSLAGTIHSFHFDVLGAGDTVANRTGATTGLSGSVLKCRLARAAVGTFT